MINSLKKYNFKVKIFFQMKRENSEKHKKNGNILVQKRLDFEIIEAVERIESGIIILPNIKIG